MAARAGVEELDRDLRGLRDLVGAASPTYTRAIDELSLLLGGPTADDAILDRLEAAWSARTFRAFYERPLLLLASLRADALASADHPLATSFGAPLPDPEQVTRAALTAALAVERATFWRTVRTRRVQTNDVSRAIAWRLPLRSVTRPVVLVDVGCAAGLNLVGDRLAASWREPSGAPIELGSGPSIVERRGFDAEPIDVRHGDEAAWLRACVWPGDRARLDRLDDAVDAMVATWHRRDPIRIEAARAGETPGRIASMTVRAPEDALVVVYQTFLRDYLGTEESVTYESGMERWVAGLAPGRGVWIELELADRSGALPAAVVAHAPTPDGPRSITLARSSYHPSIVDVSHAGLAELESLLARSR